MSDSLSARESLLHLESPRKAGPVVVPTHNRWRSLKVNQYLFALLGLVLILGTVQVSQFAGVWSTSGKVDASGEKIAPTGANPDELKGWMTIDEVVAAYGVNKDELYAQFKVPATVPTTAQLKEIEKEAPGFTMDILRTWLKEKAAGGATGK